LCPSSSGYSFRTWWPFFGTFISLPLATVEKSVEEKEREGVRGRWEEREGGREGGRVRGSTRKKNVGTPRSKDERKIARRNKIEKHVRNETYSQGRRSIQEKQEARPFSRRPLQPILSVKIGWN
jgi:hypothetical protein